MSNKIRFRIAVVGSFLLAGIGITTQTYWGEKLGIDHTWIWVISLIGILGFILWAAKGGNEK